MGPQDELTGFTIEEREGGILLRFAASFDSAGQTHDWVRAVIQTHPGPYQQVTLDLSATPRLSSTFFAAMMSLHAAYTGKGLDRLVLKGVDRRTHMNLQLLRLDGFFTFDP